MSQLSSSLLETTKPGKADIDIMESPAEAKPAPDSSPRLARALLAVIALVSAITATWVFLSLRFEHVDVGSPFSIPDLPRLDGAPGYARAADPAAPRLLMLIRPSCQICRQGLAELEQLVSPDGNERIQIIALGSRAEALRAFKDYPRASALTVIDESRTVERAYGRFRVPTVIVLSNGRVHRKVRGREAELATIFRAFAAMADAHAVKVEH